MSPCNIGDEESCQLRLVDIQKDNENHVTTKNEKNICKQGIIPWIETLKYDSHPPKVCRHRGPIWKWADKSITDILWNLFLLQLFHNLTSNYFKFLHMQRQFSFPERQSFHSKPPKE